MLTMQVAIRTEAHPNIGIGHLMRMLALVDWLHFYQVQTRLVLTDFFNESFTPAFKRHLENLVERHSCSLYWQSAADDLRDAAETLARHAGADWLMLDSYAIGQPWLTKLMEAGCRVGVVDDRPGQRRSGHLMVDPTLFSSRCGAVGEPVCFSGAHYFLAAVELARRHFIWSPDLRRDNSQVQHWFVSFGGTDVKMMLPHTLRTLAEFVSPQAQVTVAVNPSVPHMAELCAIQHEFPASLTLIHEAEQVISALANSDFAIGAAGGMTMERALLGIPSLATQVADNQANIYQRLQQEALSYTLEPEAFIGGTRLRETLRDILAQRDQWSRLSQSSLQLTQGLGAGWLAQYLCQSQHEHVYLCRPGRDFCERLFTWQSLPQTRRYARNPAPPSWQEHSAWCQKKINSHNCVLAEIIYRENSVGMLRLDHLQSSPLQFEISILLAPEFHGRGIARQALRQARKLVPFGEILAFIQPENQASLRTFAAAGYQPAERDNYFRQEALYADPH